MSEEIVLPDHGHNLEMRHHTELCGAGVIHESWQECVNCGEVFGEHDLITECPASRKKIISERDSALKRIAELEAQIDELFTQQDIDEAYANGKNAEQPSHAETKSVLNGRLIHADTFHFAEFHAACKYWTNGMHIVHNGQCRCGKEFALVEQARQEAAL